MKKKAVLILLLLFAGATFAEEKEKPEVQDLTVLSEKMDVMEKYIKKIVEEIVKQQKETEELKKDVEKLKETLSLIHI